MIYCPGKFLFIHIPRTGGTSVSVSLTKHIIGHYDFVAGLSHLPGQWMDKHATAVKLRLGIPEFESIHKFTITRPFEDIVASDYRLHQRSLAFINREDIACSDLWRESVALSKNETLEQFKERRWTPWTTNPTGYWLGPYAGQVKQYSYEPGLHWTDILSDLGLPNDVPLESINVGGYPNG